MDEYCDCEDPCFCAGGRNPPCCNCGLPALPGDPLIFDDDYTDDDGSLENKEE